MNWTDEDWHKRAITMARKWVEREEVDFDADDILYICKALLNRDAGRAEAIAAKERAEREVRYAYDVLKEFDNYGSNQLDVCAREVHRVATADQPQAIAALRAEVARKNAALRQIKDAEMSPQPPHTVDAGVRLVAAAALAPRDDCLALARGPAKAAPGGSHE